MPRCLQCHLSMLLLLNFQLVSGQHNVYSVFLLYFDDFLEQKEVSLSHALIEFLDEKCMAVVPLQQISGSLKHGEIVSLLWNNRMEYSTLSSIR